MNESVRVSVSVGVREHGALDVAEEVKGGLDV